MAKKTSETDRHRTQLKTSISRRQFLRMVAAGGAASVGLAACRRAPTPPTPTPRKPTEVPTKAPTQVPTAVPTPTKAARFMRIASWESGGAKETMDPAFSSVDPDGTRNCLVYNRLVFPDSSFVPQPELAESWESNSKGDVWTFYLNKGVKFHDGRDFTARDVVYTFLRLVDPKTGSPAQSSLSMLDPDGIEAVSDYTVRFKLPSPLAEFPLAISNRFTYIVPEGSTSDELRSHGIGTGPFEQLQFAPGVPRSLFLKNENYWEDGLPLVDGVEVRAISEATARTAALQAGQIDVAMLVDFAALSVLEADADIKVVSGRTPYVLNIAMWCDTPPFDDNRVRLALKYVMDRQTMVDTILLGHGNVANDHPVAPWVAYGWQAEPRKQDLAKAKDLLVEAGYENGLDLELFTAEASPGMVQYAQVFKEMAAGAGINVKVTRTPEDTFWSEIWMQKPFHSSSWSGRPCDEALFIAYHSEATWNETHFYREDFDDLIEGARMAMDPDRRSELYQKAQQLLSQEGGTLIPMFLDALSATRANVTGWEPHPTNYVKDFRRIRFTD